MREPRHTGLNKKKKKHHRKRGKGKKEKEGLMGQKNSPLKKEKKKKPVAASRKKVKKLVGEKASRPVRREKTPDRALRKTEGRRIGRGGGGGKAQ